MPDPVSGMSAWKRRRTRLTRRARSRLESIRRDSRTWLVEEVNDTRFLARVPPRAHGVVTGYPHILSAALIERFATLVNVHPSLLPCYRGAACIAWCQHNGEELSGYTLHEVTEAVDDGPILHQGVVRIAGETDPLKTITAVAIPVTLGWIGHIVQGDPFELTVVDARAIYKVCEGYRLLSDLPPSESAAD